jgi:hypothetical protein
MRDYSIINANLIEAELERLIGENRWSVIEEFKYLSSDFIRENKNKFDFENLCRHQQFTPSLVSEFLREFSNLDEYSKEESESFIDTICCFQKLNIGHYIDFKDILDWDDISRYQNLDKHSIYEFRDKINFESLSANQYLTEEIVEIYQSRLNFDIILSKHSKFANKDFYLKNKNFIKNLTPFINKVPFKDLLFDAKIRGLNLYPSSYQVTKEIDKELLFQYKDLIKISQDSTFWEGISSKPWIDDEVYSEFKNNLLSEFIDYKNVQNNLSAENLFEIFNKFNRFKGSRTRLENYFFKMEDEKLIEIFSLAKSIRIIDFDVCASLVLPKALIKAFLPSLYDIKDLIIRNYSRAVEDKRIEEEKLIEVVEIFNQYGEII